MYIYVIVDTFENPISDRLGVINCAYEDEQEAKEHIKNKPNLKIVTVNTRPKTENYWKG